MGRSVTLIAELPPNRKDTMTLSYSCNSQLSQLMEGATAGVLIPKIVRREFQDLLEVEVFALTGAQLDK